jgi:hypothetical protein
MKNIIVYTLPNGAVSIVTLCNGVDAHKYIQANNLVDCGAIIIEEKDLPTFPQFRNAYKLHNNKVVVDIQVAKKIKLDQFRQARKPLLEQLDVEFMRAVELSNAAKKKSIAAKKQQLRDVTSIELPNDVDELAKFWPDVLNGA